MGKHGPNARPSQQRSDTSIHDSGSLHAAASSGQPSLSSKAGFLSGPDKPNRGSRMSLVPCNATNLAAKKRLSMTDNAGPPPTTVTPYLAGPAVAAFCGQRASQKAELLQYLDKHKAAAGRILCGSDSCENITINNSTIQSMDLPYPAECIGSSQYEKSLGQYRLSATAANCSSSSTSRNSKGLVSGSPTNTATASMQRRSSVSAYLDGKQDLVATVLDGVPYVNSCSSSGAYCAEQQQGWTMSDINAPEGTAAAAAAAAGRHSAVKEALHYRISEAVARCSSSPTKLTSGSNGFISNASPPRIHEEVSGIRHLLLDEGRARRASCTALTSNSQNNTAVTEQIFAIGSSSSSSGLEAFKSQTATAAAIAKTVSNSAIYPAAYDGLIAGARNNNGNNSGNNSWGDGRLSEKTAGKKCERVSVGDYSYGQGQSVRCSSMAAAAFMHMHDAQPDWQQQSSQNYSADYSLGAAAAAIPEGEDSEYSSSSDSGEDEPPPQQHQQYNRPSVRGTSIIKTKFNRGWRVASTAAACRRSSMTAASPSACAAAVATARRASGMQAIRRCGSSRRSSGTSSDGCNELQDLAATGRRSALRGHLVTGSDSSSSSSSSVGDDLEAQSVKRIVNRARRSSAAAAAAAAGAEGHVLKTVNSNSGRRSAIRKKLLLRIRHSRPSNSSSSSARSSSSDEDSTFLAHFNGSRPRSSSAVKPPTSVTAARSSAFGLLPSRGGTGSRDGKLLSSTGNSAGYVSTRKSLVGRGGEYVTSDNGDVSMQLSKAASTRMRLVSRASVSKSYAVPMKLKRKSSSMRRCSSSSSDGGQGEVACDGSTNSSSSNNTRRLSNAIEVFLNPDDKPAHRLSSGYAAAAAIVMSQAAAAPVVARNLRRSSSSNGRRGSMFVVGAAARRPPSTVAAKAQQQKQQQISQRASVAALGAQSSSAAAGSSAQEEIKWVASVMRRLSGVA